MPGPIDGLKQVQPGTTLPRQVGDAILGTSNAMLGLVGLGPDDSSANRFGQMVGAGLPFLGGLKPAEDLRPVMDIAGHMNPVEKGLVEALHGPPQVARDPQQALADSRVMGRPRMPVPIKAPEGFDFGKEYAGTKTMTQMTPKINPANRQAIDETKGFYSNVHNMDKGVDPRFVMNPMARPFPEDIDIRTVNPVPTVGGVDELQGMGNTRQQAPQQAPLIQNGTANMRGKTARAANTTPVSQLPADTIEQIQRAAGTGKYNQRELLEMFPQLASSAIQKILGMPWKWK